MKKISEMINTFYKYAQDPFNEMRSELENYTKTNGINIFMEYMNATKKYPESGVITLNLQVSGNSVSSANITPTVAGSTQNLDAWAKAAFKANGNKLISSLKKIVYKYPSVPMPIDFPIKTEFPIDVG